MKKIRTILERINFQSSLKQPLLWLWIATLAALPVWIAFDSSGWDAAVYQRTMHAVTAGHDPYADDISRQTATHLAVPVPPGLDSPFSYIYPPTTLLLLRVLGTLPEKATIIAYWFLYAVSTLSQLWVAMQFVKTSERKWFLFLAPVAPFFPGLLANGVLLCGNIACLLYAAILLTATLGWTRKQWFWFYAAVLVASCFKPPYLTLIVIAPLSARRQWMPAAVTAAIGTAAFAAQAVIWPQLFRHYLQVLDISFHHNREFGCGPAGLISDLLYRVNGPYRPAAFILYLCYALPLFALILYFSRRYFDGLFSTQEWLPILLVGVVLLNPRLLEYDVAPLTLPLALIGWRVRALLQARFRLRWILFAFLVLNAIALFSWPTGKLLDGVLIVALFSAGSWRLWKLAASNRSLDNESLRSAPEQEAVASFA